MLLQPENDSYPSLARVFGSLSEINALQPLNAPVPMEIKFSGKTIDVSFAQ